MDPNVKFILNPNSRPSPPISAASFIRQKETNKGKVMSFRGEPFFLLSSDKAKNMVQFGKTLNYSLLGAISQWRSSY